MSNFENVIVKAKETFNPENEPCYNDFQALKAISKDEFDLIYNSFIFGYIQGRNATLEEVKKPTPLAFETVAFELETITANFEALLTAMNNKSEFVFDPLMFNVPVNALVRVSKTLSELVDKSYTGKADDTEWN